MLCDGGLESSSDATIRLPSQKTPFDHPDPDVTRSDLSRRNRVRIAHCRFEVRIRARFDVYQKIANGRCSREKPAPGPEQGSMKSQNVAISQDLSHARRLMSMSILDI